MKGLAELHGGTVEAHSEGQGRGSEFVVLLPVVLSAATNVAAPKAASPADAHRRKVLIADDNEDAAESMSMLLQMAGHEVRAAHLGHTALSNAQSFRPDVVLLDIGMPDISGYEVARRLRQEPWSGHLLMIALTGWGQDEDLRQAAAAGFDHHLCKPVDPEQLIALIHSGTVEGQLPRTPFG